MEGSTEQRPTLHNRALPALIALVERRTSPVRLLPRPGSALFLGRRPGGRGCRSHSRVLGHPRRGLPLGTVRRKLAMGSAIGQIRPEALHRRRAVDLHPGEYRLRTLPIDRRAVVMEGSGWPGECQCRPHENGDGGDCQGAQIPY